VPPGAGVGALPGAGSPLPAERAPVGETPTVKRRLALQRPRPILIRLYALLLSDLGLVGAPARRRAGRWALRSLPAAAALGLGALVVLRAFAPAGGWRPLAALAALAVALGAVIGRRFLRLRAGEPAAPREQLELGALFVVAALAVVQGGAGGPAEPVLHPLLYLVMAFLVAFLAPRVAAGLVGLALALELAAWAARGARGAELRGLALQAAFLLTFAALARLALAAQLAAGRAGARAALDQRRRELDEQARAYRLAPSAPEDAADREERDRRWTEGAVIEIGAAVSAAVEIAAAALRCHTCAVFWLSDDERELRLRDCRSPSEAITREPLPAGEGPLGGAVRRKAPVRLHGEVKGASYYLDGARPGALLAVPLVERQAGHVRGVVVVDRLAPEPFGEADEKLLQTLAQEILRAVDAERLMRDVRETRAESDRFYHSIVRLNRTRKPLEVFEALIAVAREMAPVDHAAIVLRDPEDAAGLQVVRVEGAEHGRAQLEGHRFPLSEGLVGSAVRMNVVLPAAELDPAKAPVFGDVGLKGIASLKILPLDAGDGALGALVIGARRPHAYRREAVQQLEVVAMHAGQSLERARLFDATERLATTDGLTGLVNHRTFQERLDAHLAASQRYGKKLSLILTDIDHFKSVNDTYGHPMGDKVLKGIARTLAREARATDVVARYGGEEFAIVMPETDTAGALVIAERIRERVAELSFDTEQGPLKVTLSLGIASVPDDAARKADLIERADGCLYHAKRHGRNQSVSAESLRARRRTAG
jgi:diguanylate cyclase (GGDEF)-like protein